MLMVFINYVVCPALGHSTTLGLFDTRSMNAHEVTSCKLLKEGSARAGCMRQHHYRTHHHHHHHHDRHLGQFLWSWQIFAWRRRNKFVCQIQGNGKLHAPTKLSFNNKHEEQSRGWTPNADTVTKRLHSLATCRPPDASSQAIPAPSSPVPVADSVQIVVINTHTYAHSARQTNKRYR